MPRECLYPPPNGARLWQFRGFRTCLAYARAGRPRPPREISRRASADSRDREYLIRMNRLRQMLVRSKADRTLATFLGTFGRDHADRQPRKVFSPRIQLMSFSPSMTGMKPPHPWAAPTAAPPRVGARPRLRSQSHRECPGAPLCVSPALISQHLARRRRD